MKSLFCDGAPVSRDAVFQSDHYDDDDNDDDEEDEDYKSVDELSLRPWASSVVGGHDGNAGNSGSGSSGSSGDSGSSDNKESRYHRGKKKSGAADILRKAFAQLPCFEEVDVEYGSSVKGNGGAWEKSGEINHERMAKGGVEEDKDEGDGDGDRSSKSEEQKQEFEFRLFAAVGDSHIESATIGGAAASTATAVPAASMAIHRVRLDSPLMGQNPGFVVPSRPREYYLAGVPLAAKRAEFESVAVDGEEVRRGAGRVWFGCGYEWRVIRVRSSGDRAVQRGGKDGGRVAIAGTAGGGTVDGGRCQFTGEEGVDTVGDRMLTDLVGTGVGERMRGKRKKKKSKPSKKARIKIRTQMRAQEHKKNEEREKKMRKNRMRKMKRREKEKREKDMMKKQDVVE